jgi:hypothetical protein
MLGQIRTFPSSPTDEQIAFALKEIGYARIDNWLDTDYATGAWFLQLALLILCFMVWWKLVEKKRLMELSFYGFAIMTLTIWIDEAGYELGLWYYPVDLIPIFPPSTAIDYMMLPVLYALVYQYCRTWKSFVPAISLLSAIFSFVLEPLLIKFGFYVPIKWTHLYSFPLYITLGVMMKLLVEQIKLVAARDPEE